MIRKYGVWAIATIMAVGTLLAGCGKEQAAAAGTETAAEVAQEQGDSTVAEAGKAEAGQAEAAEVTEAAAEEIPDIVLSSNVWNVKGKTVVICRGMIEVCDDESGKVTEIWRDEALAGDYNGYGEGKGLVLGDKLYFVHSENYKNADDMWKNRVIVESVSLDGSDLKQQFVKDEVSTWMQDISYVEGMLYVSYTGSDKPLCLTLDEKGDVIKSVDAGSFEEYADFNEETTLIEYANNGNKVLLPSIMKKIAGKYVYNRNYSTLTLTDAATGAASEYSGQSVAASNGKKMILYHYNSDSDQTYEYGVLDVESEEYVKLFSTPEYVYVVAMDDENVYYRKAYSFAPGKDMEYYSASLSTGEEKTLYVIKGNDSMLPDKSVDMIAPCYRDGKLYTCIDRDYAVSYVCIDVATGAERVILDRFEDPGISEIGKLLYMNDEVKYKDVVMATSTACVLQLDDRYKGAAKINETMKADADSVIEQAAGALNECSEWYDQSGGEYFTAYSYETAFSGIKYNDGHVINIIQTGYDFMGGAHGMPYMTSYVFDLDTGVRLSLKDLVSIDEATLDELMVEYATAHMHEIGEEYWEGYEDTVRQYRGLEDYDYYLTDKGVVFYFPPYMLASYAAGFQEIEIPYDKLDPTFR